MPGSPSSPRSIRTSASSPSLVRWYPVLASMVVAPDRSQRPSRSRTPLHSVQGSVPLVTVTVDETPPPAAAISAADEPLDRMASSAQRLPAYTGWVWASISPGVTRPPPRFSTWSTSTMSSTTPGMRCGSSAAGPTQAIRSSPVTMAALLRISDPVHSRPMLVSSRTVTGCPPQDW